MALPTDRDIERTLQWALPRLPAATYPGKSFESTYPAVIRDLAGKHKLKSRVEWDSYGQGYASYVDAWFYQDNAGFRLSPPVAGAMNFTGLYVLLCRLAPYYVMGQGAKSWTDGSGSSYLPHFSGVDQFPTQAVKDLAVKADTFLASRGLVRLGNAEVAEELPPEFHFDSNHTDGKPRLFDALFFWND